MKGKRLLWVGMLAGLVLVISAQAFAQVQPVQNRIPQQVIINGQRVNGAYVPAPNGGLQSFTCSNPQQYVTFDGAMQGWACYDQATAEWLLNAVPPSPPPAPVVQVPAPVQIQPPTVIYQQPATVIYQQPVPATVVYTVSSYPVVFAPVYSSRVVLARAAIQAGGRIVSAAISGSRYPRVRYVERGRRR